MDTGISCLVAVDFDTTYTSIAYCKISNGVHGPVRFISNYPHDTCYYDRKSFQVPTVLWYLMSKNRNDLVDDGGAILDEIKLEDFPGGLENIRDDLFPIDDHYDAKTLRGVSWGYAIGFMVRNNIIDQSKFVKVAKSKLLLDDSPVTLPIRNGLRPELSQMKRKRLHKYIKHDEDVIEDFLTILFAHSPCSSQRNCSCRATTNG
jgi:hypothetical protein